MVDFKLIQEDMEHTAQILTDKFSAIAAAKPTTKMFATLEIPQSNGTVPLAALADISPKQNTFIIRLYDSSSASKTYNEIDKVIREKLNFGTTSSGNELMVQIPVLTEEKRKEYAKMAHKFTEEVKIQLRKKRQHHNDELKKLKGSKDITEDEYKRHTDHVQKICDQCVKTLDAMLTEKEKSIMNN